MFDQLPTLLIAALVVVAFVAGWVDSVVGGGGLIQLPALLIALPSDTPPPTILGVNKMSSAAGTLIATYTYLRRIKIHWRVAVPLIVGSALGAAAGAWLAQFVPKEIFTPIVLVALIAVAVYTWRRPTLGLESRGSSLQTRHYLGAGGIGLGIGAYDGILGPGTGSFFVIALVALLGYGFLEASATAKLANLVTNLASLVVFGITGYLLLGLGLVMAAANLTGGLLGARMALRYGNGFVRTIFLVVAAVLILTLGWQVLWQVIGLFGGQ